jgi:nucleoside-diphosphate-sugar epimerase
MRVLVAGATGVLGRQLVPLLAAAGHEVVGLARTCPGPTPDRPVGPTPDRPVGPTPDRPVGRALDRPAGPTPDRPVGRALDRLAGLAPDRPVGRALDRPAGLALDRPAGLAFDRPAGLAFDRLAGLALEGPGGPGGTRAAGQVLDRVRMVAVDALDRAAVGAAVRAAAPDAIVSVLTAIPAEIDPKRMAHQFQLTNRLRTEGTRNLLEAAAAVGVRRFVAEGLAYAYDPRGAGLADEDEPLWRNPPAQFASSVRALADLERRTRDAGGLVLRFGHLYGPGTIYAPDGSLVRQVRAGKMPVVGRGAATFSFTHTRDGAAAVLAALTTDVTGALNIVDDDPALVAEWLPALATLLGAPAPGHVPAALARLAVGGWGVAFMTRLRGAANTRARQSLDWQPQHPSWRDGFRAELTTPAPIPSTRKGKS